MNNMEDEKLDMVAEKIDLDIVFEDDSIIVINKPTGMIVHPSNNNLTGTLVNGLLEYYPDIKDVGEYFRPGIVHRLDKDTSGLLVVAKNSNAYEKLVEQFQEREPLREYTAIVYGLLEKSEDVIVKPIGRDIHDRTKMAVTEKNGKKAITKYKVIDFTDNFTVIQAKLKTGRTHQIRVHFADMNHPVVGDDKYSKGRALLVKEQLLHASKLGIYHPVTDEYMEFESEVPERFTMFLNNQSR